MAEDTIDLETSKRLGELASGAEADKAELDVQLSQLFEDLFGQMLTQMEIVLPFEKSKQGAKSLNEIQFGLLRAKILRLGNDKIRSMRLLLDDYFVKRMVEHTKTTIHFFNGQERNGHG